MQNLQQCSKVSSRLFHMTKAASRLEQKKIQNKEEDRRKVLFHTAYGGSEGKGGGKTGSENSKKLEANIS